MLGEACEVDKGQFLWDSVDYVKEFEFYSCYRMLLEDLKQESDTI